MPAARREAVPAEAPGPDAPEITPAAEARIAELLALLASEPDAPSSVRDPERARRVHVADSLSALEFSELAAARQIADLGSGAGFPGIPIAAALPNARVDLIESIGRKCEFLRRALRHTEIENARVVCERSETWAAGAGREAYDLVAVRAVGRLATLAELASPLLREGGWLLAWKGRRDPSEEEELAAAAPLVAIEPVEVRWVGPYAGSRHRHLHLLRKVGPTPAGLPRRPGVAKKRPLRPRTGEPS